MLLWHPDRHADDLEMNAVALEKAKVINEAYEFISNLLRSQAYIDLSKGIHSAPSQGQQYRQGFPDPTVVEVFVESSNIFSIGYNRDLRILYIKFKRKQSADFDVYNYFNVPERVFHQMLAAESKGKFAHRHVYPYFRYEYIGRV